MPKWFIPFVIVGVVGVVLVERWTRPDFSKESSSIERANAYTRCIQNTHASGFTASGAFEHCRARFAAGNE